MGECVKEEDRCILTGLEREEKLEKYPNYCKLITMTYDPFTYNKRQYSFIRN